jgi:hypothetical protein
MGTSSSLFSGALSSLTTSNASSIIVDAIESVLEKVSQQENDIAAWPNAFKGWDSDNNPVRLLPSPHPATTCSTITSI